MPWYMCHKKCICAVARIAYIGRLNISGLLVRNRVIRVVGDFWQVTRSIVIRVDTGALENQNSILSEWFRAGAMLTRITILWFESKRGLKFNSNHSRIERTTSRLTKRHSLARRATCRFFLSLWVGKCLGLRKISKKIFKINYLETQNGLIWLKTTNFGLFGE